MRTLRLLVTAALAVVFMLIANGAWAQDGSEAMSRAGAHLVLSLDADEVRAYWLTSMRDEIRGRLRESLGSDIRVAKGEGGSITIAPTERGLERRTSAALDNTLAIVTRRLDEIGLAAS